MTGYQSKKLVTNRHADPITLDHIIALRKDNERLRDVLQECAANFVTKSSNHKVAAQEILDEATRRALLARAALKESER